MTNEELCCDKEHSLLLKETGLMGRVEADGYFAHNDFTDKHPLMPEKYVTETYRLDKILAKLPEWVFASYKHDALRRLGVNYNSEIGRTILSRMHEISIFRVGQAASNAAAKLLHLLWKEGVE